MEKYYTPKIGEFHVGFEYEHIPGFTDGTVKSQEEFDKGVFEKEVFRVGDGPYINRALNGRNAANGRAGIRVKYLDEEDIHSLMFVTSAPWQWHTYTHYMFKSDKGDNIYGIRCKTQEERLFYGIIKNISEFKKILKQVKKEDGIHNNI